MPALRFFGHACFAVTASYGSALLVDPFHSGEFGGAMTCPPLPDEFDYVVTTHDHADHAAVDAVPSARVVPSPGVAGPFRLEHTVAAHDEFGGRLRGGLTRILRIHVEDRVVVHLGDLGERPSGPLLAWLRETPIDALIVPVGGYFTLGGDGAAELCSLLDVRRVLPCHSEDDGLRLRKMAGRGLFVRRFGDVRIAKTIPLDQIEESAEAQVMLLERPR